jgi:sugar phosphate isomerase/epimerase
MIRGIAINSDDEAIDGDVERLEAEAALAEASGFDGYELTTTATNMLRGGRVDDAEVERVRRALAGRRLRYTMHPPTALRMADAAGRGEAVMRSLLEVAARLRVEVVVYHSAQLALRPADQDTRELPGAAELRELRERESEALRRVGRQAEQLGVVIALENRDPHLWELAALARHGRPPSDLLLYHAGMSLDGLVQQLSEIASPAVGMCLDVGHAFLAAPYWPEPDYLGGVRRAAPWIRHLHFHDNFGRLDDVADSIGERLVLGEADAHLPPGWGDIPLAGVLAALRDANYAGWVVTELRPRYAGHWPEVAATVRRLVTEAGLVAGG